MYSRNCLLLFALVFFQMSSAFSQTDSLLNSFHEAYRRSNPNLNYSYNETKQIHNYSNNWDLDGDGVKDEIFFVGTGGAHLFYFLRVKLSSDNLVRDFNFLQTDFPVLPSSIELSRHDFNPETNFAQFAVIDLDRDKTIDIFIRISNSTYQANIKTFRSKKLKTNLITLSFNNGKAIFKDYHNGP